ncbi:MAG: hypothetical protein WKF31_05550 [Thermoleophilaceae bacterium]
MKRSSRSMVASRSGSHSGGGSSAVGVALLLSGAEGGEAVPPFVATAHDAGAAAEGVPAGGGDSAVAVLRLPRKVRVGQEVHHRAALEVRAHQVEQRERAAAERALGDRRALVEVDGDAGLAEGRLDQRAVLLALAVGDGHVVERHARGRPLEAGACGGANLPGGVGGGEEADGVVLLGRRRRRFAFAEQAALEVVERGAGRLAPRVGARRRRGLGRGAEPGEPAAHVLVGAVGGRASHRKKDGQRRALGDDRLDRRAQSGRRVPEAVDEQSVRAEVDGVRDRQAVVGSVVRGPALGVALVELHEVGVLAPVEPDPGPGRPGGPEPLRRETGLRQLAEQPVKRIGEPGRVRDRPEVAARLAGHLADQDTGSERRERLAPGRDHPVLPEAHRQLGGGEEVQVDVPAEEVGETPLEVGPQQRAADEDGDRRERIPRLAGGDLVRESLFEAGKGSENEPRAAGRRRLRAEHQLFDGVHSDMVSRAPVAVADSASSRAPHCARSTRLHYAVTHESENGATVDSTHAPALLPLGRRHPDDARRPRGRTVGIRERPRPAAARRGAAYRPSPAYPVPLWGAGIRRPALVGRRLYVWQVIATLRESDNSIEATADYLHLSEVQVRACLSYYADFADEVDAAARRERDFAEREEARWKREQEALA